MSAARASLPTRRRRSFVVVLALVVAATAVADPEPQPEASTLAMAERLATRAREFRNPANRGTNAQYFRYNAPWTIPTLRRQVERESDPARRATIRSDLARQLLWDGHSGEARDELARLRRELHALDTAGRRRAGITPTQAVRLEALANLRVAEQVNCLGQHTPESCLFPIRGGGVHRDPRGSRAAVAGLTRLLERRPNHLATRWLLNIAYMTLGEHPDGVPARWRIAPEVFASDYELTPFPDVAGRAGVDLSGLAGGAALEDFDGDGHLDVVASSWGPRDQLAFLHNRGDGTFENRTAAAGIAGLTGGLNLNHADYDNDGRADVLVLRGGWLGERAIFPNSLLHNLGNGRFEDVTQAAGVFDVAPGQTAAWGDYDNDGQLDVFVGNETTPGGRAHPCRLYHNDGDGRFTDAAPSLGLANCGFVKGVAWGDVDNDGRPDLYWSRMAQDNRLYRNETGSNGSVRFRDVTKRSGVAEPKFSFPTWFFDYDNDGWLDLFVAAWDPSTSGQVAAGYLGLPTNAEHPRLYHNRGDGTFEDVTSRLGMDRVLLAMGANYGDLDNDGWLDVYVGTGAPNLATLVPNRMFRNDRGQAFQDVTTSGGFGHLQKGHGIAFGDVDGDGDQDVYSVLGGWYTGDVARNALFENPGGGRFLTLRFRGTASNRSGVGARIRVHVITPDGERVIHRVVGTGGSFGSSSLQQEIGLGNATAVRALEVDWPASGVRQRFEDVTPDAVYRVREDADTLERVTATPRPAPAS